MNGTKSAQSGQIGGIVYIVLAVLSFLGMIMNPYIRSFWTVLEIAAYACCAVMLLLRRKDFLVAIGFGLLLILSLRSLFIAYGLMNILVVLLQVLAYGAMTLFALADFIPSVKEVAKKYWFIPAGAMVICIIPVFLTAVFNWLFHGLPFFTYFVVTVFSGVITYGLSAAGLFFAAAWIEEPETLPFGNSSGPRPQYQRPQAQDPAAGNQGPRVTSSEGTDAAGSGILPSRAYCGLAKHVLLLIFTFGIWYLIWIYRTTDNLNCLEDEPPRNPATKLLLCMFIPFYSIYWVYKSAQRIDRLSAMQGRPSDSATLCLILAILIGIVPPILMQDKINGLVTAQGGASAAPQTGSTAAYAAAPQQPRVSYTAPQPQQSPRPAAPVVDVADELKKYKELLDMGAITQEEYDTKKKQLLGL